MILLCMLITKFRYFFCLYVCVFQIMPETTSDKAVTGLMNQYILIIMNAKVSLFVRYAIQPRIMKYCTYTYY